MINEQSESDFRATSSVLLAENEVNQKGRENGKVSQKSGICKAFVDFPEEKQRICALAVGDVLKSEKKMDFRITRTFSH